MINEKNKFLTVSWLSGLLSAEIFISTGEWGVQMPPLTSENSHFLQSGPQGSTLVMYSKDRFCVGGWEKTPQKDRARSCQSEKRGSKPRHICITHHIGSTPPPGSTWCRMSPCTTPTPHPYISVCVIMTDGHQYQQQTILRSLMDINLCVSRIINNLEKKMEALVMKSSCAHEHDEQNSPHVEEFFDKEREICKYKPFLQ